MISSIFIDILFWIGLVMALIGGIMVVASFTIFKRKVMKTPIYENVEQKPSKRLPWGYILFLSGMGLYFLSYFLSVR